MKTWEERREEERRYEGDVRYEVWRQGGNVDRIDHDRVNDSRDSGYSYDQAASREVRAQRPQPRIEEEYPKEQFEPDEPVDLRD